MFAGRISNFVINAPPHPPLSPGGRGIGWGGHFMVVTEKRWLTIIYLKLLKKSTNYSKRQKKLVIARSEATWQSREIPHFARDKDCFTEFTLSQGLRDSSLRSEWQKAKGSQWHYGNVYFFMTFTIVTSSSYTHKAFEPSFQRFWSISPCPLRLTTSFSLHHCPNGLGWCRSRDCSQTPFQIDSKIPDISNKPLLQHPCRLRWSFPVSYR